MEPNQWVDVQFGVVFGPEAVTGQGNFSGGDWVGGGGEELKVMLADGTNVSVVPSAFNEVRGCGGLLSLENETVGTIERCRSSNLLFVLSHLKHGEKEKR